MMRWRGRLGVLDTTLGQILSILLGGLVVTLAVIVWLLFLLRPDDAVFLRGPHSDALQLASLIEVMQAVPANERPGIAAAIDTAGLRIRIAAPDPACNGIKLDLGGNEVARALARLLPAASGVTVHQCPDHRSSGGSAEELLEVRAPALGIMFDINVGKKIAAGVLLRNFMPLIGALLFLFILVAVLSAWAIWRIIFPLQRLSQRVERFGREVAVAPLTEQGPREIRRAARAFNQMQERVAAAVRDRTRMLAAISHDLRTPITRMRLRTELEQSGDYRHKTLRDLDLMQRMISSALDLLRGDDGNANGDPAELVAIGSLLETVCDEVAEAGNDVTWLGERGAGAAPILCRCRPNALGRAVTNLIANACLYGKRARVAAWRDGACVWIEVGDDGPGIPEAWQSEALKPFCRLDTARAMGDGVGLGLSIVADIARDHGGRLDLSNHASGGLLARILLPETDPGPVPDRGDWRQGFPIPEVAQPASSADRELSRTAPRG